MMVAIGTEIEAQQVDHGMIVDFGSDRIDVVTIVDGPDGEVMLTGGNLIEHELRSIDLVIVRGYFNP